MIRFLFFIFLFLAFDGKIQGQGINFSKIYIEPIKIGEEVPAISYLKNHIENTYHFKIELDSVAFMESNIGHHYTFYQSFGGLVVYNSFVKINISKSNELLSMVIKAYNTKGWELDTSITSYDLKAYGSLEFFNHQKNIFVKENQPKIVLKTIFLKQNPLICELWLIDTSGPILKENRIVNFKDTTIRVKVFHPDPLTSAKKYYGAPYRNDNDSTNESLNLELKEFKIAAQFDETINKFRLENGNKKMIDFNGSPINNIPLNITDTFFYTRNMKEFESVNAFFHISQMEKHIKSLGISNLANTKLVLDGHGKDDDNSAFIEEFTPRIILYGEGGVDDAEDADVVVHEYMHYVSSQAAPNSNTGFERRSLDEGLADYFACAYSKDIDVFRWQDMFTWDGHNEYWKGRNLNNLRVYSDSVFSNDIHNTGLIWAGLLANINIDLGRQITDKLQLNAMFSYFPDMGFLDATDLLLQTEKAIYNEKYKCLLQKHLRERGLISPEVSLECYDPSISFEANFTSKAVCKSDKTRIGIKPESLINKENTYFWTPSNYLQEYNTSNPIFESTNSFTYQVTVCDKLGKCNSKNINITINNCHLEIEFYNSMAFSNGSVSLTIRLPDTDTLLLGYSLQIFNDQGRLVGNKTLDNKYFNYFHTNELPDVKGIYILKIVKIEQQKSTITKTYKVAKI